MPKIRLLLIALLLLMLLFVTASVSAFAHEGPQTWTVAVGLESSDLSIQGILFAPSDIYVHKGDIIHWIVQTHDLHTVTFPAKGQPLPPLDFTLTDPQQVKSQGGPTYDGLHYFNSGLLSLAAPSPEIPPTAKTYDLVMGVTGKFDYYCLIHGTMMHGVVHVKPVGADLPYDHEDIQHQITKAKADMLHEGHELNDKAEDFVAKKHVVLVGIGEMAKVGMVEIVRFFPAKIQLAVGQTLTFESKSMMHHTFSIVPPNVNPVTFNPFAPAGDGTNYTGGLFNRFVLPGTSFTLKVTKALDTPFFCALHDNLGMVGQLTVK